MTRWRILTTLLLGTLLGLPALIPFVDLLAEPQAWQSWSEGSRIASLAWTTLELVGGTLALVMPVGILGAVLLYRTDLPGRRWLRLLMMLSLFIPLPLFTSAWQAAIGTGGWLPMAVWNRAAAGDPDIDASGLAWKPWAHGLGSAVWIHAVAGLPWVVVLVGQGLCWVERELEEDALTAGRPWQVLWRVSLPRSRAAIAAAALWIGLFAATEITVSDMMQVRTFAEEVYTQFVGDRDALARAVAVSLPMSLGLWLLVVQVARGWERRLPSLQTLEREPGRFPLGRWRYPALLIVLGLLAILIGVPVFSLVWKAGLGGKPPTWSAAVVWTHLEIVLRVRGTLVITSLLMALVAGLIATGLGLLACWLAVGSGWFHAGTLSLIAWIWALAGPVLGLGLKGMINHVLDWIPSYPLAIILYYGPSPVPAVWAHVVRFFPCAMAVLWPVMRLVPTDFREMARVDGATAWQEFRYVIWPLSRQAAVRAAFAVGVLSLGELSASKLVETPGSRTFAHEVFDQMHYGVSNDLAALCLILLATVLLGGLLFAFTEGLRSAYLVSSSSPSSANSSSGRSTASPN